MRRRSAQGVQPVVIVIPEVFPSRGPSNVQWDWMFRVAVGNSISNVLDNVPSLTWTTRIQYRSQCRIVLAPRSSKVSEVIPELSKSVDTFNLVF